MKTIKRKQRESEKKGGCLLAMRRTSILVLSAQVLCTNQSQNDKPSTKDCAWLGRLRFKKTEMSVIYLAYGRQHVSLQPVFHYIYG